ncbi:MAG: hypothetical protein H7Z41_08165, partial [Cytophagales bacterium]|nr:hypothetical protein [Armatimonadota bacterium]
MSRLPGLFAAAVFGAAAIPLCAVLGPRGEAHAQNQNGSKPEPAPTIILAAPGTTYPEPGPPADPDALGRGVQRTMTLLATSSPKQHNKVRILFYGQSITEQDWSKQVAEDLRRRFPHADLEIENRAIGGFASQLLIRPAEHDLYPFYPDLVIFHVYGADNPYETIIRNIRSRTTSEVLIQKDHATQWPPETVDRTQDRGKWWDDYMNHVFLPATAKKYRCGLDDVRTGWVSYLKTNRYEPKQLLKDGVHLNDHGNFLMARLVSRYLVYRPGLPKTDWQELTRVTDVGKGGKEAAWKGSRLEMPFQGNRVDLILASGTAAKRVQVLIDGRKPGDLEGAYRITRPTPNPWAGP